MNQNLFERISRSYSASCCMNVSFGSTSGTNYRSSVSPSFSFIFSRPIRYARIKVAARLLPWTL